MTAERAAQIAFWTGGAARRADLRAALSSDPTAADLASRVLPFWRGKPLLFPDRAAWLAPDHVLAAGALAAGGQRIFLGLAEGAARFAQDVPGWQPPELPDTATAGPFDASEQAHPAAPAEARFADLRQRMARLPAGDAADAATGRSLLLWHASHGFCAACGAASQPARGGWQRDCPACGRVHFPRTDPVVIMRITDGNRVLLGRSPGWPEGMFSLLVGFVEPGETVEAAVRREVAEETGVQVGAVRYLASQPWPYPSSLMLGCEGRAKTVAITLDPVELEQALWLTRENLVTVFAGRHPAIRPPRRGSIAAALLADWLADRGI